MSARRNKARRRRPIDAMIGARLTIIRLQHGLTTGEVGQAIGVNAADVADFESGRLRIGAAHFYALSSLFDARLSRFFPAVSAEANAPEDARARLQHLRAEFDA